VMYYIISALLTILPVAVGFSTFASAAEVINISGAWKIDSENGPSPLCRFDQVGNNLTGSCEGPQAKGTLGGAVTAQQVRWHWQWVTHSGGSAGAFDFNGTLKPDNTITGTIERREIGFSLNFTAKRQSAILDETNGTLTNPAQSAHEERIALVV